MDIISMCFVKRYAFQKEPYNNKLRGKNSNTQAKQRHDELKSIIEEIYHKAIRFMDPGKVFAVMHDLGYHVSSNTIAKIMHENG